MKDSRFWILGFSVEIPIIEYEKFPSKNANRIEVMVSVGEE